MQIGCWGVDCKSAKMTLEYSENFLKYIVALHTAQSWNLLYTTQQSVLPAKIDNSKKQRLKSSPVDLVFFFFFLPIMAIMSWRMNTALWRVREKNGAGGVVVAAESSGPR